MPINPFDLLEVNQALLYRAIARIAPCVFLIPAFGLRTQPIFIRAGIGFILALSLAPMSSNPQAPSNMAVPDIIQLLPELLVGFSLAIAATIPLWSIEMAGGVVGQVLSSNEPNTQIQTGFKLLYSMLAFVLFFFQAIPSRLAIALSEPISPMAMTDVPKQVLTTIIGGIDIAVMLTAPFLILSVLIDFSMALLAKIAVPLALQNVLQSTKGPLLTLVILLIIEPTLRTITWQM